MDLSAKPGLIGTPGAAEVIANGPAARLLQRGGTVIITYTQLTDGKLPGYQPQIVT
jgi:aspartate 1-decarboxylase